MLDTRRADLVGRRRRYRPNGLETRDLDPNLGARYVSRTLRDLLLFPTAHCDERGPIERIRALAFGASVLQYRDIRRMDSVGSGEPF